MQCIAYKSGYKYQLKEDYLATIDLKPDNPVDTPYLALTLQGELTIKRGYAWDGPSGPTIDTLDFMRGSLIHDALYQLMREQHLNKNTHRKTADRILQKACREDGMNPLRVWWVYLGVRFGGDPSADPANKKPFTRAPKACQQPR